VNGAEVILSLVREQNTCCCSAVVKIGEEAILSGNLWGGHDKDIRERFEVNGKVT
jgi:hypothetical protein